MKYVAIFLALVAGLILASTASAHGGGFAIRQRVVTRQRIVQPVVRQRVVVQQVVQPYAVQVQAVYAAPVVQSYVVPQAVYSAPLIQSYSSGCGVSQSLRLRSSVGCQSFFSH